MRRQVKAHDKAQVLVQCACERYYPLWDLYYCEDCKDLRCRFCIREEIDSYYCPCCLDYVTSSVAAKYNNRCVKCFECPRCSATLTFSQNIQSDEYFLKCGHCRWSSLSALSKGEGSASTPEDLSAKILKRETEQAKAPLESTTAVIHALHEEHLEVMFQKRQKRSEKILLKAAPERALSSSLSSREGVHAAVHHLENARLAQQKSRSFKEISLSRKGRSDGQALTILDDWVEEPTIVAPVKASFVTAPVQQALVSPGVDQYLEHGVQKITQLPIGRKCLLSRRSKRCSTCDKLLVKPSLSATEFKRQHSAAIFFPSFTVFDWRRSETEGDDSKIYLYIRATNPVEALMSLVLKGLEETPDSKIFRLPEKEIVVDGKGAEGSDDPLLVAAREREKAGSCVDVVRREQGQVIFRIVFYVSEQGLRTQQVEFLCTATSQEMEHQFRVRVLLRQSV